VRDPAFQAVPELVKALDQLSAEKFPKMMAYRTDATTYLSGGCHNLPIIDICTTARLERTADHPPWSSLD
jgi:hypothetical protein